MSYEWILYRIVFFLLKQVFKEKWLGMSGVIHTLLISRLDEEMTDNCFINLCAIFCFVIVRSIWNTQFYILWYQLSLEYTLEDFVIFIYIYTFRMDIATPIFQGKFFLFVERKGKKIIVPTGATKYFMNH